MQTLRLTSAQQKTLAGFVLGGNDVYFVTSQAVADLLESIMVQVDVRRLELVDPSSVRELLRATFEVVKARHLLENNILSRLDYAHTMETAQQRLRYVPGATQAR